MSPRRRAVLLSLLAALAIAFAAAVTWATSQLVSQRIGLSSEPPSAGLRLLPRSETSSGSKPPTGSGASAPTTTATQRPVPAQPSTTRSQAEEPSTRETPGGGEAEGGDRSSGRDD